MPEVSHIPLNTPYALGPEPAMGCSSTCLAMCLALQRDATNWQRCMLARRRLTKRRKTADERGACTRITKLAAYALLRSRSSSSGTAVTVLNVATACCCMQLHAEHHTPRPRLAHCARPCLTPSTCAHIHNIPFTNKVTDTSQSIGLHSPPWRQQHAKWII